MPDEEARHEDQAMLLGGLRHPIETPPVLFLHHMARIVVLQVFVELEAVVAASGMLARPPERPFGGRAVDVAVVVATEEEERPVAIAEVVVAEAERGPAARHLRRDGEEAALRRVHRLAAKRERGGEVAQPGHRLGEREARLRHRVIERAGCDRHALAHQLLAAVQHAEEDRSILARGPAVLERHLQAHGASGRVGCEVALQVAQVGRAHHEARQALQPFAQERVLAIEEVTVFHAEVAPGAAGVEPGVVDEQRAGAAARAAVAVIAHQERDPARMIVAACGARRPAAHGPETNARREDGLPRGCLHALHALEAVIGIEDTDLPGIGHQAIRRTPGGSIHRARIGAVRFPQAHIIHPHRAMGAEQAALDEERRRPGFGGEVEFIPLPGGGTAHVGKVVVLDELSVAAVAIDREIGKAFSGHVLRADLRADPVAAACGRVVPPIAVVFVKDDAPQQNRPFCCDPEHLGVVGDDRAAQPVGVGRKARR